MRPNYLKKFGDSARPAIADVSPAPDIRGAYEINRINVPDGKRGNGYGSQLLRAIIADADLEDVVLVLGVLPSGPLDGQTLEAWYRRYGFKGPDERGIMIRKSCDQKEPEDAMREFGLLITEVRERWDLTQRALAAKLGITNSYLSQIEHGKHSSPSFVLVMAICEELDLDPRTVYLMIRTVP